MSLYQRGKIALKSLFSSGEDNTSKQLKKLYEADDVDDSLIRDLENKLQKRSPKESTSFQRDLMLGGGGGLGLYGAYQMSGIGKQSSAQDKEIEKESSPNWPTVALGAGLTGLGIAGFNKANDMFSGGGESMEPTDMPLSRHQMRQLARRRAERRRAAM